MDINNTEDFVVCLIDSEDNVLLNLEDFLLQVNNFKQNYKFCKIEMTNLTINDINTIYPPKRH